MIGGEVAATGTTYTIEQDGLTVVRIYDLAGNYGGVYKANIDKTAPPLKKAWWSKATNPHSLL